ncbi:MAG TPA: amino acid adenylation domain-containing protein [Trichocoleus sp.]|jgi:amino acid adenylation domain-containing protein
MVLEQLNDDCFGEEVFLFPASFAQQRLWFLDQLVPDTALYNVPTVFRLSGRLNIPVLEQSFQAIVQRHETLRTTFDTIDGQLTQVISPQAQISLPLIDLSSYSKAEQPTKVGDFLRQAIEQPFDLRQGALLRLLLLNLEETEHILLINLHHIIFDEWSSGVLIRELGAFYTALLHNQPVLLPELPIQYADFACWQRDWLQGERLAYHLQYWRQQLKDLPILTLPEQPIGSPVQSSTARSPQGAMQFVEFSQALLNQLEAVSQQENVTLFMTLLAAFQTLLYRYTEQTDIVVGSPIANRHRSELEDLIGFFVNSVVLRTDLSGNPTFRSLLSRVQEVTLGAYAHQDLPFEKLVAEIHPERHLNRNPLFQVVFALQNAPMDDLKLPGLTLSSLNFETKTTRFDLEFYVWKSTDNFRSLWGQGWQRSDGLRGVIVYNACRFTPEFIRQLSQNFETLLTGITTNPNTPIAHLPLLAETEQQQILLDWNNTKTSYPADRTIHQLFETQAAKTPNAVAIQFGQQQFSYLGLNQGSNQLAHYLRKQGVGIETKVAVCLDRSPQAIAAMLGILKAGGAYVPLDPTYPAERLQFILKDAQVSIILTEQQWTDRLGDTTATVVCFDRDWEAISCERDTNPKHEGSAKSLAYIMYTSGSTGQPKGVAVIHQSIIRLVCKTNYIQLRSTDKVAQAANLAFDAATFEIWGALLHGAQLIGVEPETLLSPTQFVAQLRSQQISVLFLTTALLNQIVSAIPSAFASLKYLLFGGEAVNLQRVKTVLQAGKPKHLLHVYGPTENTTFTSWYEVKMLSQDMTTVPIGRPIANTQIYLLDTHLNPVPVGVVGEIYVGGDGLARGYFNQPELTQEWFIPHPFNQGFNQGFNQANQPQQITGKRLYRTGDLARYRADGNLEFIGRRDDQIKLRGFRIELSEIETRLNQHPAIAAAAVNVQTISDDRRLVAYVVLHEATLSTLAIQDFLRSTLPDYMVPSLVMVVDAIPLTPNGKIDRRALPIPTCQPTITPIVAPQTSIETTLAEIWSPLLGVGSVSVHDNFFEAGGHSLLATQLISRIRDVLQIEIPLRCLFETPTIAGLAQFIQTIQTAQGTALSNRIPGSEPHHWEEVEL